MKPFLITETGYFIAVSAVSLYDRHRDVMVAYALRGEDISVITVHPLKEGQKQKRIQTGRWRKIDG